jgi:hypothetical protein
VFGRVSLSSETSINTLESEATTAVDTTIDAAHPRLRRKTAIIRSLLAAQPSGWRDKTGGVVPSNIANRSVAGN